MPLRLGVAAIITVGSTAISAQTHAVLFREYSNIRYTEEHAYGVEIELWRVGTGLVAMIAETNGLQADFPNVPARVVVYDENTGTIRLEGEWCKEPLLFAGVFRDGMVTGTLTRGAREPLPLQLRQVRMDEGLALTADRWEQFLAGRGTRAPRC